MYANARRTRDGVSQNEASKSPSILRGYKKQYAPSLQWTFTRRHYRLHTYHEIHPKTLLSTTVGMSTNNSPNDAERHTQQQTGTQSWGDNSSYVQAVSALFTLANIRSSVNATCACSANDGQQHQTDPNNNAQPGPGPPQDGPSRNLEFAYMGAQFEGHVTEADEQA
jgi:hypothetical protein